jgi:hypothetical protein
MQDDPTSDLSRYRVGITLEVEASTGQVALQVARDAGRSLQSRQRVLHASMDIVAVPLFDDAAFAQIPGQTAIETSS